LEKEDDDDGVEVDDVLGYNNEMKYGIRINVIRMYKGAINDESNDEVVIIEESTDDEDADFVVVLVE